MKNSLKWTCEFGHETIVNYLIERKAEVQGNKSALKISVSKRT